jgi:hypothetical protein
MTRKQKAKASHPTVVANVTEGAKWLEQLSETAFRDEVLKDLLSRMQKEGIVADYLYTHGRGEHGVDWIVQEKGGLSRRYVGIQAKSRTMTRQGDAKSDSALAVKLQCEAAYDHKFNWNGNEIRLDVVELWMSAHITLDAEVEFNAPSSRHKVVVKRNAEVFKLIEHFCPRLVSKIPGLAEAGYLKRMANPEPLPIRIFGIHLNPRKHFVEPRFSQYSHLSPNRVFDRRTRKMREETPISVKDILDQKCHCMVVGSELSGKTYLLRRISCLVADKGNLPVYVDGSAISKGMPKSVPHLLHSHLDWYSLTTLQNPDVLSRTIYLLIDNADDLSDTQMRTLHESAHRCIIIVAALKNPRKIDGYTTYYIAGIQDGAVHQFVRSLDLDQAVSSALTDRAMHFIERTTRTSGLPSNPFTVSVMLSECQIARRRLTTPTMGRLIERFVEDQLGSHLDTMRADFETKLQFLTHLGGAHHTAIPTLLFRKRLAHFLSIHGHAHDISDFELDIFESGLVERDETKGVVRWTHPIFRDFFWVRNLVREKKYRVIARALLKISGPSIAAITGSQMGNAHAVLGDLLSVLHKQSWMNAARSTVGKSSGILSDQLLPSDSDEDVLLKDIEERALGQSDRVDRPVRGSEHSAGNMETTLDENITKSFSVYATRFLEERHYVVGNVSALLLNARSLSRSDKETAALCILRSNARMAKHLEEILQLAIKPRPDPFIPQVMATFLELVINDLMMGDAFLCEIFRGVLIAAKTDPEKIAVTDLLVACGSATPAAYIRALSSRRQLSDLVAVYIRLVHLYYFRFHKEKDKAELRDAMKSIRQLAKGFSLPPVT